MIPLLEPKRSCCNKGTWIDPEEKAYPNGAMHRKGKALFDEKLISFKAGIPDTFFSIPAKTIIEGKTVNGWISCDDNILVFHANKAGV